MAQKETNLHNPVGVKDKPGPATAAARFLVIHPADTPAAGCCITAMGCCVRGRPECALPWAVLTVYFLPRHGVQPGGR